MPSKTPGWPPRWISKNLKSNQRTRGPEIAEFINAYARVTKESVGGSAGTLLNLRPWQLRLLDSLFAEDAGGLLIHRTALIGMARKNGKSVLGAALALWSLYCGEAGGEVYSCAATRDQARIVFGTAKRMVELDPELAGMSNVYRDAIEIPETGSVYRVLSREAGASEGLSPTFVVFDEVHVQPDDELWNVMQLGAAARREPMMLGITTAGARTDGMGRDTLCYRLYQHGKRVCSGEIEDPTFFFSWWEPRDGVTADHTDPKTWRESNPGFGDLNAVEDFKSTLVRTPEAEFRTKRTNVFVVAQESALPNGAWEAATNIDREVPPGTELVLGFDGSWSGDSTGLVGCTRDGHLFVVDAWERLEDPHWRVPIADVEARIIEACKTWQVLEVACDPYRWQRTMQALQDEGLPIVEWPTSSVARIVPAWQKFYDAVLDGRLSHSGDLRLARHMDNMRIKRDARGGRPVKDARDSQRKIDLGICAVIAFDRATQRFVPEIDPSTQIF